MPFSRTPLVEPFQIPDTFLSDLAFAEPIGPDLFRLTFCTVQTCAFDMHTERVVSFKAIWTRRQLAAAMARVIEGTGVMPEGWEKH